MTSPPQKIPVILCIDVEPDPFLVNRYDPEPWAGYEFTHRYLAELRGRLADATESPVHYTWGFRMDPQVALSYGSATWAADNYPTFIAGYRDHGDELGTHPHGYRWLDDKQMWLEDLGNQGWIEECVGMALEAHTRAFGSRCDTFRFGNFWMNTATIDFVERHGVRFDLTVEPGRPRLTVGPAKGLITGFLPDFYRVPREPYFPSKSDFRRPGENGSRRIRMIPLTSSHLDLGFRIWRRALRLWRNGARHRLQDTPMSMWKQWNPPNTFDQLLRRALAAQGRPYLAFAIRTSIGVGRTFDAVNSCLQTLLQHPARKSFVFTTPAEALETLGLS